MSERGGADAGPPMTLRAGLRRWFLQPPRPHGEVIEDRTVSFLELFYDLVYVVLIAQVAHTLAEDVSWSGVLDFAVVFGLIWIGWFNGTAGSFLADGHPHRVGRFRRVRGEQGRGGPGALAARDAAQFDPDRDLALCVRPNSADDAAPLQCVEGVLLASVRALSYGD